MKPLCLIILYLCLVFTLQAQVSKTVHVTTPGSLSTLITQEEMTTLTDLTLTGTLDARDFKTMKSSMPKLENVELAAVTIAAYSGKGGTFPNEEEFTYPANEFPACAFYDGTSMSGDTTTLKSIVLPASINAIGAGAFENCVFLNSIDIPSGVSRIKSNAFASCRNLTLVNLPPSLTSIESWTFADCSTLSTFTFPTSLDSIQELAFCNCINLVNLTLPSSLRYIGPLAFDGCNGLTALTIPSSVSFIGHDAFNGIESLKSIYVKASYPVDLSTSPGVFWKVSKNTCTLYVPYKTMILYANADQWKDFKNIVEENTGVLLSKEIIKLDAAGESDTLKVFSNISWTVNSDFTWLALHPGSGTGDAAIVVTAAANTDTKSREAKVVFSGKEGLTQEVVIIQEGQQKTISIEAGKLSSALTPEELNTVTGLKITGIVDVRDFWVLRDKLPLLTHLDLSEVNIVAYQDNATSYAANEIPANAFYLPGYGTVTDTKKSGLNSIILPSSITSIGESAFYCCSGLTSLNIPPKVTRIKASAFGKCSTLTSITIPKEIAVIEWGVFAGCNANITVDAANKNYSSMDGVLFNKNQTKLIYYPALRQGDYTMPSSVTGMEGFYYCTGLTSIHWSPAMTTFYFDFFTGCSNLNEIYIPSTVSKIYFSNNYFVTKANFIVDADNPNYSSEDGILFNKKKDVLIKYSATRQGSYTIPATVSAVMEGAFWGCTLLSSVTIPAAVDTINDHTFEECVNLTSVTLPSSLIEIGFNAFTGCSSLTTLNIPASVTMIAWAAFYNCTGLKSIYCYADTPPDLWLNYASHLGFVHPFKNVDKELCILYVPVGKKALYAADRCWKEFKNIVEMANATKDPEQGKSSFICYPNPFTSMISIEIANPSLKEINVDIYSISGQKIRSLVKAQKGAKITFSWDGTDGQGMQVPKGMYLVKMNERTRKVVRE